jgi:hypothetical protein
MTGLMLEALVARVAATLELIFPGSEVELRDRCVGRGYSRYPEYEIILKTSHPRLSRDGRYYTSHCIPEEYLLMEGEAFVQHLITSLPSSHIRQITDIAIDTAHATRFKKTGHRE